VTNFEDGAWSSLSPVRFTFDGVVCGHSLCTLSGRRRDSSGELIVLGGLFVWGDEMRADAGFNDALGKIKDEGRLSPQQAAGLWMAGWKR